MLRALIWDVDGTIAETERDGHRVAFNQAFAALGLSRRWDVEPYGELLQVAGGRERLLHDMPRWADAPRSGAARVALAQQLHERKTVFYAQIVARGQMQSRPGVQRLMDEADAAGVRQAIATTTSRSNVDALFACLFGAAWRGRFAVVVCGEDAPQKKPHPQAYTMALHALGVSGDEAMAIEDSPGGLQAARRAGVCCGVTPSTYFADAEFHSPAWLRPDLDSPAPMTLPMLAHALAVHHTAATAAAR